MEKTYYIEAARHEKNEYRVEDERFFQENSTFYNSELPAYNEMVEWMKKKLQPTPDNKIAIHKLDPEYNALRSMNITSHETTLTSDLYRVIPDSEIILDADEPFQEIKPALPYEAKGYDLFEGAYFFATVDTWRTVKPYRAESAEQALQMAQDERIHETLSKVQPIRQFLYADKEHKVTLQDGTTVDIVGEEELTARLREKFPDGLTVRLADESFANLLQLQNWNGWNAEQFDEWMGLGNPGNDKLLVAIGSIPAELKLLPEDYKHVFACEETYYDEDLLNLIEDDGLMATSLLLSEERNLESFRLKIPKSQKMIKRLFIAGKPFETMMQMARDNQVKDDRDFTHMLDKAYMHEQPEWVKKMAIEQTMTDRNKAFINLTAKPSGEGYQAYGRLLQEKADELNCSVNQLQKYMKQPSTVPEELRNGVILAATEIHEKMKPYEAENEKAFRKFIYAKARLEAEFTRKLHDFIARNVKEVTMYPNNQGKWHVRCQINGEQQMGRPIEDSDARIRKERNGNFQSIKLMACKYFQDEILSAMNVGQQQSRSLHR